jgi:hypothetical protein
MIRKSLPTLLLLAAAPCLAIPPARHTHPATTHPALRHSVSKTHRFAATPVHHETVAGMSPDRATQIQTALIKSGYMTGEPTGVWNAESNAAMQKLQGDNGWQTKITPDSRALIKLGLGPQPASSSPAGGGSN